MSVRSDTVKLSVITKRTLALPGTELRQGMPWLRGEASGLLGLRTANLQRDRRSRLESPSFGMTEDVNSPSLHGGNDLNLVAVTEECDGPRAARDDVTVDSGGDASS